MDQNPAGTLSEEEREALEYVESVLDASPTGSRVLLICAALRRLSRAGDGPVAWRHGDGYEFSDELLDVLDAATKRGLAHPQAAAQGVTDEMVIAALNAWFSDVGGVNDSEVKPDHPLFIDMRAALTAALEAK